MEHRIEPLAGALLRRVAALASIAVAVLLITGGDAAAASPPLATAPSSGHDSHTPAAAEPEEEVEWEWSEEEEEEVEWEFEEGEEEIEVELEFEGEASRRPAYRPPTDCVLQSASARVTASDTSDSLRLSLRYASREPARVEVHYSADGVRGEARLDPTTLRATRHGRIEYTEHPGAQRMSKVRTAHTLVVTVEVPRAPSSCQRQSTMRLPFRRHGRSQIVWSEAPQHPRAHRSIL